MEVNQFNVKLNKVDGNVYVIEEKVFLADGVYSGELKHDNINQATLAVYTGLRLTGDRIQTFTLSTPSLTPWKRGIKIFASVPEVYITYETDGDTVEAEDVNRLQAAVTKTQTAVNTEYERATRAEEVQQEELDAETRRAQGAEAELAVALVIETGRAEAEERKLLNALAEEVARAAEKEAELGSLLQAESERAAAEEEQLAVNLNEEANRSQAAEKILTDNLLSEAVRAQAAEQKVTDSLDAEIIRAKEAEAGLKKTIDTNKPKWDDKYTKNEVDNKFSTLETAIDWKESVAAFADLAKAYPSPQDGWTVNVKDTDYTYRFSGSTWVAISANSIPKATKDVDGLLAKEDKAKLDDTHAKRHEHGNKSIIDTITQTLLNNWNAAFTHISDMVKHITAAERLNWNTAFTHAGRKDDPHGTTKEQIGLGDVEDKNGAAIRAEMTKAEVVKALGYTPPMSAPVYTHPDSGVAAGTYRSVTINVQGHVTGGTNPTTLAEYGITDAMQKGPFTWEQMRGVFTWNQLKGV